MSVLKRILVGVLGLGAALVLVGFLLPSSVHVERTTTIQASQPVVFTLVNGFRSWNRWSPWFERDPQAEYTFEGPEFGIGARMIWASESPEVGAGSQEIVASEPYRLVRSRLDFGPQGSAEAFFRIEPLDEGTRVTWGFDTEFGGDLVARYFGLMFDRWVGADYESGLRNLRELAESLPQEDWTELDIELVDLEATPIAFAAASASGSPEEVGRVMTEAYGQVRDFLRRHELEQAGPPVAVTTRHDPNGWEFQAGIPLVDIPGAEAVSDARIRIGETPSGKTLRVRHVGPYATNRETWEKIGAFAAAHGYEPNGPSWEEYVSDPGSTRGDELVTYLMLPVE